MKYAKFEVLSELFAKLNEKEKEELVKITDINERNVMIKSFSTVYQTIIDMEKEILKDKQEEKLCINK